MPFLCLRDNCRDNSALARWFHDREVVVVATGGEGGFVPGSVLLVATIAGGVGDAAMLQAVQREPLRLLDHALTHCQVDEALPGAVDG